MKSARKRAEWLNAVEKDWHRNCDCRYRFWVIKTVVKPLVSTTGSVNTEDNDWFCRKVFGNFQN